MSAVFAAGALTGGGVGALDAIDGTNLVDLDIAIVQTLTDTYLYSLDDDSGAAESSPDVISPDTNAGTKRWILSKKFANDTAVLLTATQTLTNKTLSSPVLNTGLSGTAFLDEDNMASDSATKVASQQSIKAYADAIAEFASTTVMLFGQASAPTGWTKKTNWQNQAILTLSSDANGTALDSGGSVAAQSTHTHTGPSHTHTGPSHTHTGPSHTHTGPSHYHKWYDFIAVGTTAKDGAGSNLAAAGTLSGGNHICEANDVSDDILSDDYYTSSDGTGATGAGGTGATGAGGTGATGAGGTGASGANTAPYYQEIIVCTKD